MDEEVDEEVDEEMYDGLQVMEVVMEVVVWKILHVVEDTFVISHKSRKHFHQSSPSHPKIILPPYFRQMTRVWVSHQQYIYNQWQSRHFRTSFVSRGELGPERPGPVIAPASANKVQRPCQSEASI